MIWGTPIFGNNHVLGSVWGVCIRPPQGVCKTTLKAMVKNNRLGFADLHKMLGKSKKTSSQILVYC